LDQNIEKKYQRFTISKNYLLTRTLLIESPAGINKIIEREIATSKNKLNNNIHKQKWAFLTQQP